MTAAKAKKTTKKKAKSELDYETAVSEVEGIVRSLESGELDLTESLKQYEKGIARLKDCHAILASAEQTISLLSGFDADGQPITEAMPEAQPRTGSKGTASNAADGRKRTLEGGDSAGTRASVDGEGELF